MNIMFVDELYELINVIYDDENVVKGKSKLFNFEIFEECDEKDYLSCKYNLKIYLNDNLIFVKKFETAGLVIYFIEDLLKKEDEILNNIKNELNNIKIL